MKITSFTFKDYPQFTLKELFYENILSYEQGFFESNYNYYNRIIIKNALHMKMFSSVFLLKEASENNFYNTINQYEASIIKEYTTNFVLSLFDCYFYKNATPLGYAFHKLYSYLSSVVCNDLYKKLTELQETGWFDIYYNEELMMKILRNTRYVTDPTGINLGSLYTPHVKRSDNGESLLIVYSEEYAQFVCVSNKNPPTTNEKDLKVKSKAQKFKESVIDDISSYIEYDEEEKIVFIEEYLNEHVNTEQSNKLIKELKKLYRLNHKYKVKDNLIHHDYKKLLDKDLLNLLKFLDIYKNEENEGINLQIEIIYKLTKNIKEKIFNEVDDLLSAKNRYLEYKLKETY